METATKPQDRRLVLARFSVCNPLAGGSKTSDKDYLAQALYEYFLEAQNPYENWILRVQESLSDYSDSNRPCTVAQGLCRGNRCFGRTGKTARLEGGLVG